MNVEWIARRQEDVVERATAWVSSRSLSDLVAALGGPTDAEPSQLVAWTAAVLDTRGGRERRDAPPLSWDKPLVDALVAAAEPLGLVTTGSPNLLAYDSTIVLGGAATGNRLRTELAEALAEDGVALGSVTMLTAARSIGPREHETDPDSADDTFEWRNLLRHAERVFGPLQEIGDVDGPVRQMVAPDGLLLRLLIAPSSEGRARASTGDAVQFFLARVAPSQRRHVLLVTSAIYAPYQFFTVAPSLLDGGALHVELVATPTATDGRHDLLAQRYAQEIHAGASAAAAVIEAARA